MDADLAPGRLDFRLYFSHLDCAMYHVYDTLRIQVLYAYICTQPLFVVTRWACTTQTGSGLKGQNTDHPAPTGEHSKHALVYRVSTRGARAART